MKLFLQKTANCTGALLYAAALPAPRAAARGAAPPASPRSAAKHLAQISVRRRAAGGGGVALRKKRNRDEISEAEHTDAVRDLERVFAKSPS